jgi:TrmH family RNA methyltransferase
VAAAARLHRRRGRAAAGATLLEGPILLAEALARKATVRAVFGLEGDERSRHLAGEAGVDWVPVTESVLRRLATTEEPQSPVAVVSIPEPSLPRVGHLVVAWGVTDPGNVGTLIRAAAAFDMGFVAGPGTADPWAPKVLRAAAGGHWHTTVGFATDVDALRGPDRVLAAAVVRGGSPPEAVHGRSDVCLLIGGEASGLPRQVVEAADLLITVPMPGGTESLNAAMAGVILAYETRRGTNGGGGPRD